MSGMTFDEAFNAAKTEVENITVEGRPETWGQRLRLFKRPRFRPTAAERIKAYEAARTICKYHLREDGRLPRRNELVRPMQAEVGVGPLTLLWVIATVVQLIAALKRIWGESDGGR